MKLPPLPADDFRAVEVEANDIAIFCAGLYRFRRARLKAAAEVEMLRVITADGGGGDAEISLGKMPVECLQILEDGGARQALCG